MVGAAPWRREPLPRDWGRRRRAVLERDGHTCTWVVGKHDGGWDPQTQLPVTGWPSENTPLTEVTGWVGEEPYRCDKPGTEVDHTGPRNEHPLHLLRTLCTGHHRWRTSTMAAMDRWARERAQGEAHPGLRKNRQASTNAVTEGGEYAQ